MNITKKVKVIPVPKHTAVKRTAFQTFALDVV